MTLNNEAPSCTVMVCHRTLSKPSAMLCVELGDNKSGVCTQCILYVVTKEINIIIIISWCSLIRVMGIRTVNL